jgi:hypothetical protein
VLLCCGFGMEYSQISSIHLAKRAYHVVRVRLGVGVSGRCWTRT